MRLRSKTASIEATLRERIDAGDYENGNQLPTVRQLCEEFGVAKVTIGNVLARLEAAAVVIRIQGSGLYVRRRVVVERHLLDDVLTEYRLALTNRAGEVGLFELVTGQDATVDVEYHRGPADDWTANMLHLEPGAPVLRRTFRYRLTGSTPTPYQVAYGWMSADLADLIGLVGPDSERKGVGTMAQMVGAGLRLGMESLRIESRMPTPAESAELAIPPGTPVFERHRRLWTARPERRPVEVGFQVVPADRVAYLLDVDLEAVQP